MWHLPVPICAPSNRHTWTRLLTIAPRFTRALADKVTRNCRHTTGAAMPPEALQHLIGQAGVLKDWTAPARALLRRGLSSASPGPSV